MASLCDDITTSRSMVIPHASNTMSDETNNVAVISWPVNEREPIDGCTVGECCKCHKQVWLSLNSQKIIEITACPIYCVYCARIEPDDIVKWSTEGVEDLKKRKGS
jgi:hypothetical protein